MSSGNEHFTAGWVRDILRCFAPSLGRFLANSRSFSVFLPSDTLREPNPDWFSGMIKLSLSVRIAEAPCKTRLNVPFRDLVQLAAEQGYRGICMRASAAGIQTPLDELTAMRAEVERAGLIVTMVTADSDVPLNNEHGPDSLRASSPA